MLSCTYVIMKTMCPPSYHHNGFMATHVLRQIRMPKCMSCHKAIVLITGRTHCFHDNIYITLILPLLDLSTLSVVDHLRPLIYLKKFCNRKNRKTKYRTCNRKIRKAGNRKRKIKTRNSKRNSNKRNRKTKKTEIKKISYSLQN